MKCAAVIYYRQRMNARHSGAGQPVVAHPTAQQSPTRWRDGWSPHPYAGLVAVLATRHNKLPLIGPALTQSIGLQVEAVAVDTDSLGTFTGDILRLDSPLNTAVAKARLAMRDRGATLGLASEGSIGPHPAAPFVTLDRELAVLVDDAAGIVVAATYDSLELISATTTASPGQDLRPFLDQAQFPDHRLIVRPNSGGLGLVVKNIDSVDTLVAAISSCAVASSDHLARVETDLRAHVCPSRRPAIAAAASKLAARLAIACPVCAAPGWGPIDRLLGLPCAWCRQDVPAIRAEIDACPACDHRHERPLLPTGARADPGLCPRCNP